MANPILVPFNGSEAAERALTFATELARLQQCPIHLLAVAEFSYFGVQNPMELAQVQMDQAANIERMKTTLVAPRVERLRAAGIEVDSAVEAGAVTQTILDVAERSAARMIVVGRRGGSRLSRLLLGSTASALVQTAHVPVLVVP